MTSRVLIVDDDAGIRESAALALEKAGYRTVQASDTASALQRLREQRFDVVLSDIYMPGDDGIALLQAIAQRGEAPRVILMTARGTIETTAIAQKFGAFDYIAKPFHLADLVARVGDAAAKRSVGESVPIEPAPPSRIVGSHPRMVEMYKAITRVAALNVPVLVHGESGSGKELVAQSIHDLGTRAEGPFVAINCGAVPDTLLENELFGSVRGAYTDARQDRRGALSRADHGTLFLDEIGDTSPSFQVKLLRFLQDGVVTPLGSDKSHRVDVRVIAATHRDLKQLVADERFREDLYYRLAGYEIEVPALRNRKSDLPLLVEHFKSKIAAEMKKDAVAGPSQAVLDALAGYDWPGNVRELELILRRAIIDSGSLTNPDAIRIEAAQTEEVHDEPSHDRVLESLDDAEKRHIIEVLRATGGNQTQAAFILGIERKTLARKLKKFGIRGSP